MRTYLKVIALTAAMITGFGVSTAAACHICMGPVEKGDGACKDYAEWLEEQLT